MSDLGVYILGDYHDPFSDGIVSSNEMQRPGSYFKAISIALYPRILLEKLFAGALGAMFLIYAQTAFRRYASVARLLAFTNDSKKDQRLKGGYISPDKHARLRISEAESYAYGVVAACMTATSCTTVLICATRLARLPRITP